VIVVETFPTDSDHHHIRKLDYHGGMSTALGLARIAFKVLDKDANETMGRLMDGAEPED